MTRPGAFVASFAICIIAGCGGQPTPFGSPSASTTASKDGAAPASPAVSATSTAAPDAWTSLFRPLQLPSIEPDEGCPTTTSTATLDNIGPMLGDGPIYPAFLGIDGIFSLGIDASGNEPRQINGSDWWGKKTLWLSDETYDGLALVRGERMDLDGDMLFYPGSGPDYVSALRLTVEGWVHGGSPSGWREWNSGTLVVEPGCYAFQVDGEDFTDVIVVQADR